MNQSFIDHYVTGGTIHLLRRCILNYDLDKDQWTINRDDETIASGTLEKCCEAYSLWYENQIRQGLYER